MTAGEIAVGGDGTKVGLSGRDRFWRSLKFCRGGPWPLGLLVLFAALAYGVYALDRHWHFGSGAYDLGLFDQAIWHYSRFEAPVSTLYLAGPTNVLSDHFSPILVALAPFYWVWDNVDVLLIAQAALFASAAVPIWMFVRRRLGVVPAYCFASAYLAYWGILQAVAFDFHEIAFAVPLIAFAILFADQERWRSFFSCVVLLLLVKEDLALLIAFLGIYLILKRHRRQGATCVLLGILAFYVTTKLLMPHFAVVGSAIPRGSPQNWTYTRLGKNQLDSLRNVIVHPTLLPRVFLHPVVKEHTELAIFRPFAFLAMFSPLTILAIPLLAERFLSSTTSYWVQMYHYTATVSPVVAMSSADGLANLLRWTRSSGQRWRRLALAGGALVLALNVVTLPSSPLANLTHASFYQRTATDAAGNAALAHVPPRVSVVTENAIAPHLTHRDVVTLLTRVSRDQTYIVTNIHASPRPGFAKRTDIQRYLAIQEADGYAIIFSRRGWTVLAKAPRTSSKHRVKHGVDVRSRG